MGKRLFWCCVVAGVFLTVLGARWSVVAVYSMDVPEWDQWDAEGLHLLVPWFRDRLVPALFTPHNEHYVVLTKLLNLAVTDRKSVV